MIKKILIVAVLSGVIFAVREAKAFVVQCSSNSAATMTISTPKITNLSSVISSHQAIGGIVLETVDGCTFLGDNQLKGTCTFRVSNMSGQTANLTFALTFRVPGEGGVGREQMSGDTIIINATCLNNNMLIIDIPICLSQPLWNILKTRTGSFHTSTVEFDLTPQGDLASQVQILAQDGHVPYSISNATLSFPQSGIYQQDGNSLIQVNGITQFGNSFCIGWNSGFDPQTVQNFANSGRHNYRIVFQPWTLWVGDNLDPTAFANRMTGLITSIVGRDPQAQIDILWWLWGPKNWGAYHPNDMIVYDDGSTGFPHSQPQQNGWQHASYSSEVWKEQQTSIISQEVQRLALSPYAERIYSISLGYGNAAEWNNFGYSGNLFPDFSAPEQSAFAAWCQLQYGTLASLNGAWITNLNDWDEIAIPTRTQRLIEGWHSFAGPDLPQCVVDYRRFQSERTADLIDYYAQVVKQASSNKVLVGAYYSYFAHSLVWAPYHSMDSGHYALGRLLKSTSVDFISSPYGYGDRKRNIGCTTAVNSILLAGKAYDVECDLPTHRIFVKNAHNPFPPTPNPSDFILTASDSLLYHWRDAARVASWGVNGHWFDFCKDWYNFPEFASLEQNVQNMNSYLLSHHSRSIAKVAVLLDEESVFYLGATCKGYGGGLYSTLVNELCEVGAPWDVFLSSDVDAVIQKQYSLIIVLNQIKDASTLRQKLMNSGIPTVWGYGSGLFEQGQWTQQSAGAGATMSVSIEQPVGSITIGTQVLPSPTSLTSWDGQDLGWVTDVKPRIAIIDPSVTAMGTFSDGSTAVGFRYTASNYLEFWVMTPYLSRDILSAIYQKVGIHRYSQDGSSIYASSSLISTWKEQGGNTIIFFPQRINQLVDAATGKVVGTNVDQYMVTGTNGHPTLGVYITNGVTAVQWGGADYVGSHTNMDGLSGGKVTFSDTVTRNPGTPYPNGQVSGAFYGGAQSQNAGGLTIWRILNSNSPCDQINFGGQLASHESEVAVFLWKKSSFLSSLNNDSVSLSTSNAFSASLGVAGGGQVVGNVRWLICVGTQYYVSSAFATSTTITNYSLGDPSSVSWYLYDPKTSLNSIGSMWNTPSFDNITAVGLWYQVTNNSTSTVSLGTGSIASFSVAAP